MPRTICNPSTSLAEPVSPKPNKKLIEVALPLEVINREAAREKSIRHGHPATLHLWWARRPLAAARAVIFASLVDDPSALADEFPTEETQGQERQRLFRLIEELVKWESTADRRVLDAAQAEIRRSWGRWCRVSGEDPSRLPPFHDPFAGGGALPLEAQRLGLTAHASDLNPVAVTINKAMIEIPPRFAGRASVHPDGAESGTSGTVVGRASRAGRVTARAAAPGTGDLFKREWTGAQGLAEDLRYYGTWMQEEAKRRIGHLYPQAVLPDGRRATVIAWIWARTVESPNPAFRGCPVPLVSSFWLSTKPGKEAWVEPVVEGSGYRFEVRSGTPVKKAAVGMGTKLGRGANFRCVLSGSPISPDYIKAEGIAGRLGVRLMAVVAEGDRIRIYLSPTDEMASIAGQAEPGWTPDQSLPDDPRNFWTVSYGLTGWADLFTPRQLTALSTLSDLVPESRQRIRSDAVAAGVADNATPLREGGHGAMAYAEAVSVYLEFVVEKVAEALSTICTWSSSPKKELVVSTFRWPALPMTWDFAEGNPFADSSGSIAKIAEAVARVVATALPASPVGFAYQANAASVSAPLPSIVSTDPPYCDNIGYADLSDFFYVWMRRGLHSVYPDLFSTPLVPKADELVATPYRHGSRERAESFFLDGMSRAIRNLAEAAHPAFPVSIYYAFKQSESDREGTASTGWETFLEAVIRAGFSLTGTWPIRTERASRSIGIGTNALASSIVLVCRRRPADAPMGSRRELLVALKQELPPALRRLQEGNIAPVDLAQASIGPGMAIYSRYARILESNGIPVGVRTALALINQTLDEVLAEQEGDFDADTGWAIAWFEQYGHNDGPFGEAEVLCNAKNTSVAGLVQAGILKAQSGRVRLLRADELPADWDPGEEKRGKRSEKRDSHLTPHSSRLTPHWMMVHQLIRVLESGGEGAAAVLVAKLGSQAETARELCYRLYTLCERKKRATEAMAYNGLVQSWPEITRLAQASPRADAPGTGDLFASP